MLAAIRAREGPFPPPNTDQVANNLIVQSRLHPDWFRGDALYGAGLHRHYSPAWVRLQTAVARWLGGDPYAVLRVLYWPLGLLFFLGHYALFRALTGHPAASFLGAAAALPFRVSLGGDSWDFAGLGSVIPRTISAAAAPLFVLGLARWHTIKGSAALGLLLGLVANFHPVGAFHLAQIGILARLWEWRGSAPAWLSAGSAAAAFVVGAAPAIVAYLGGRVEIDDPSLFPLVREGILYRLPQDYFPMALQSVPGMLVRAAPLLFLLLLVRRRGADPLGRTLGLVGVLAVGVGVVGAAADQLYGDLFNRAYPNLKQFRATKFAWLPLLSAFPLAFQRVLSGGPRRAAVALALGFAVAASVRPLEPLLPARNIAPWQGWLATLDARSMTTLAPRGSWQGQPPEVRDLARWVAANTGRNDLFFTDLTGFRALTGRPITGSFKDGGYLLMAGTEPFLRWYLHIREVDACRRRRGQGCWFALASRTPATYVVVDPHLPAAAAEPGFTRVWVGGAWSLWRREATI